MTSRKPPELSFETWVDRQIEEARREGLFDGLPGHGRPQADLAEADDPLWFARRRVAREGVPLLPPALEVRRRVQALREGLARLPDERAVREAAEALDREIRGLNARARSGPPTPQAPLDPEAPVDAWRRARRPAPEPGDDPPAQEEA
ncbi:MAG: DUF1992 domain-containing protein [Myxococcota bacterium]|nr:DUF1992 domain-containing protein [Myxococcota bacterium]